MFVSEKKKSARMVCAGAVILILTAWGTALPGGTVGAQAEFPGMGMLQERLTIMQLIAGLRFIDEDPKLGLSAEQAAEMLEIFDEMIDEELLFPRNSYALIQEEADDPAKAGEGGMEQSRRESLESGEYAARLGYYAGAISEVLNKKQLKAVQSLDLTAIIGMPAGPGSQSGANNGLRILFEELYLLLGDKVTP